MSRTTLLAFVLCLSGCATIQEHPVATGVVVAVVAGSIIACTQHHHEVQPYLRHSRTYEEIGDWRGP
jgi:uncharacterized protein YceK